MTNQNNIAIKNKKAEMKDLIKIEYARCATDPAYFMKKYCRILHPKQGLIKFNLYDFQEETVSEFLKHR
jgi:arabinogalactan endo-1,4-beta-galactosidase